MTENIRKGKGRRGPKKVDKTDQAAQRFVEDLVARGEAARPGESGQLPPGATHEIVEETNAGPPKVKRRRFSAL